MEGLVECKRKERLYKWLSPLSGMLSLFKGQKKRKKKERKYEISMCVRSHVDTLSPRSCTCKAGL